MKKLILQILHNTLKGDYVSGEEISEKLGVSRTAVWKHIKSLRKMGYAIKSQPKRGYKLEKIPDLLLPEEIELNLDSHLFNKEIHYFKEIGSTNEKAKAKAALGSPEGSIVVAEKQLKGRGRRGRAWSSPFGKGIWCSMILRPDIEPFEASKITIVAAVALAEALVKHYSLNVKIKWPNDIMLEGRKLAGILTEMSADIEQVNYIVVGTGINVNNEKFPEELKEKAGSLKLLTGKKYNRVKLLCQYLKHFEQEYDNFKKGLFEDTLNKWKAHSQTLGRKVLVKGLKDSFEGIALDIDMDGRLVVLKNGSEKITVNSGDVSLR